MQKFGQRFSPKLQRKKTKASVALMKVLPNELENQKELNGFTEWLQTFELYRGKQGVEEFEDEGRVVGKFKVKFFEKLKQTCFFDKCSKAPHYL